MRFGAEFVFSTAATAPLWLRSLNPTCQIALTSVMNGPASSCLGAPALLDTIFTPSNETIVEPINSWQLSMCHKPACSSAILDSVIESIASGCSTEFGITNETSPKLKQSVKKWYSTVREVACLKE
ncbi:hypothetical protein RhiJN_01436 [Ceratobasidium sp. AG-Ba]|nr:hypothetical protein RhiJN_01436 [Ceratobasidium sp. AG-Ba]